MALRVWQMTNAFGAEIAGIDLSTVLQPHEIRAITDAWAQHRVLVFREQAISDAEHARFARNFGPLAVFGRAAGAKGDTEEIYGACNTDETGEVLPADDERSKLLTMNWFWHTDGCYRAMPNKGVVLRAIEVPADGGDTLFANMEAAYAALPAATQRRIDGLTCHHSFAHMIARCSMPPMEPQEAAALPRARHPLVRQHADGRRSLLLSPPYMETIDGLGYADGQTLVEELAEWATQKRFVYRHRWRSGDVVVWDNRWTMHKVAPFERANYKRSMRGATMLGTEPVVRVARA